jgi:hypothetical protein
MHDTLVSPRCQGVTGGGRCGRRSLQLVSDVARIPAVVERQRALAKAASDRAADVRRVLAARVLLGDQFNVDAVIQQTGLDQAAVVAALRLYRMRREHRCGGYVIFRLMWFAVDRDHSINGAVDRADGDGVDWRSTLRPWRRWWPSERLARRRDSRG